MAVTKEQLKAVIDDINQYCDPQIKVSSRATLDVFTKLVTVYAPMYSSKLSGESIQACAEANIDLTVLEAEPAEPENDEKVDLPMTAGEYAKAKARSGGKETLSTSKTKKNGELKQAKVKEVKKLKTAQKPSQRAERVAFQMELIEKGTTMKDLAEATEEKFPNIKHSTIMTEIRDGKNPKYCKYPKLLVIEKETGVISTTDLPA